MRTKIIKTFSLGFFKSGNKQLDEGKRDFLKRGLTTLVSLPIIEYTSTVGILSDIFMHEEVEASPRYRIPALTSNIYEFLLYLPFNFFTNENPLSSIFESPIFKNKKVTGDPIKDIFLEMKYNRTFNANDFPQIQYLKKNSDVEIELILIERGGLKRHLNANDIPIPQYLRRISKSQIRYILAERGGLKRHLNANDVPIYELFNLNKTYVSIEIAKRGGLRKNLSANDVPRAGSLKLKGNRIKIKLAERGGLKKHLNANDPPIGEFIDIYPNCKIQITMAERGGMKRHLNANDIPMIEYITDISENCIKPFNIIFAKRVGLKKDLNVNDTPMPIQLVYHP